ncbi:MAG TPA: hypothetical protein VFC65_00705 [Prolixibacteraceae bacterium]|nr:hypothetical protein [Prolixibacteraceae bacterium]
MQLELLLDSISIFDKNKLLDLHVVYSVTNDNFGNGYEKLKEKFPTLCWYKEIKFKERVVWPILPLYWHNYFWWFKYKHNRYVKSDFKSIVLSIIGNTNKDLVMFLTDDSIFFNNIEISAKAANQIIQNGLDFSFSLRHGKNIFGGTYSEINNSIYWEITDRHNHAEWSYPFSVDGHVYNKEILKDILRKVIFKNPNTLEGNVACFAKEKNYFRKMIANNKSCLLGFELNRVQTINNNNNLNISSKTLNKLFLNDYHMQLHYALPITHLFRPDLLTVSVIKEMEKIELYKQ